MGAACSKPSRSMAFKSSGERPSSENAFVMLLLRGQEDTLSIPEQEQNSSDCSGRALLRTGMSAVHSVAAPPLCVSLVHSEFALISAIRGQCFCLIFLSLASHHGHDPISDS